MNLHRWPVSPDPWEEAAADAPADRLVVMRTGVVLDAGTPALDRLALLTRIGLGGRIGDGSQWMSWIPVRGRRRLRGHSFTWAPWS